MIMLRAIGEILKIPSIFYHYFR